MKFPSSFNKKVIEVFRYFTDGGKVAAALVWTGKTRHREPLEYVRPGAKPIEFHGSTCIYSSDDIIRRWSLETRANLVLKNQSKHHAYSIKLVNGEAIFDTFSKLPPLLSLGPDNDYTIQVTWKQYLDAHSGVEAEQLPRIPADKENKVLTLQYQNEAGTKMYTKFTVNFDQPFNEYSF